MQPRLDFIRIKLLDDAIGSLVELLQVFLCPPQHQIAIGIKFGALIVESVRHLMTDDGADARPNLVSGVPLYVDAPTVAGGRRINRSSFVAPAPNQHGALGRNSLRGFPLSQLDFSLRRRFKLTERYNLQLRADLFNLFNHPNFGDPDSLFESATFGESVQMLGQSLGSGGIETGFSPLYQIGGPRSIQLAVKLTF